MQINTNSMAMGIDLNKQAGWSEKINTPAVFTGIKFRELARFDFSKHLNACELGRLSPKASHKRSDSCDTGRLPPLPLHTRPSR